VKLKLLTILLGLSIISISAPSAYADTMAAIETICFELTGPGPLFLPCDEGTGIADPAKLITLLNDFGIGTCNMVLDPECDDIETTTQFFTVPPFPLPPVTDPPTPPTTMGDMTFIALEDSGDFGYFFFACNFTTVTGLDPILERQAWATACLSDPNLLEIFVDGATFEDHFAGDTNTFSICAAGCDLAPGDVLVFGIIPDNSLAGFLASPGDFYNDDIGVGDGPAVLSPTSNRAPLFFVEDANPGENDQGLAFLFDPPAPADGKTMFTFEDLTREPGEGGFPLSDADFTDLGFGLDLVLIDPCEKFLTVQECLCKEFDLEEFCPIGGEFLEIDSSALLLAGLQTSAVWILPIVLAGAGTGLGIAAFHLRRK